VLAGSLTQQGAKIGADLVTARQKMGLISRRQAPDLERSSRTSRNYRAALESRLGFPSASMLTFLPLHFHSTFSSRLKFRHIECSGFGARERNLTSSNSPSDSLSCGYDAENYPLN